MNPNPAKSLCLSVLSCALLATSVTTVLHTPNVQAQTQPQASTQTLSMAQLESLVSPIALYPDSLLSQVLMASTYPLEVAEAENWLEANQRLTTEQKQDALKKETWDNSVKSLVMVPDVLKMMGSKLSWTQQLGDAYLAQPKDVMSAVQSLRKKAQQAGNLKSDNQVKVSTQQSYIVIQPTNPEVIYVPQYNPTVVYGAWAYPAYPPPPVYNPAGGMMAFGAGVAVGAAMWSYPDWRSGSITINNTTYNSFNRTYNNDVNLQAQRIGDTQWRYNPAHRGNVPYTNEALNRRYGNPAAQDAITRNRAEQYNTRQQAWDRDASAQDRASRDQAREQANQAFRRSVDDADRTPRVDRAAREERVEPRAEPRMERREMPRFEGGEFRRR